MDIFKSFFAIFSKKKKAIGSGKEISQVEDISSSEGEMVTCLLEMPRSTVYPSELLEPLCSAMVMLTKNAVCCSTDDIRLYSLYSLKDDRFYGSFYGVKREEGYFGNIVGSPDIIFCSPDAFRFVETDELIVPLQNDEDGVSDMLCRYKRQKRELVAQCLEKRTLLTNDVKVLYRFDKGTSFEDAYSLWKKNFAKV